MNARTRFLFDYCAGKAPGLMRISATNPQFSPAQPWIGLVALMRGWVALNGGPVALNARNIQFSDDELSLLAAAPQSAGG